MLKYLRFTKILLLLIDELDSIGPEYLNSSRGDGAQRERNI